MLKDVEDKGPEVMSKIFAQTRPCYDRPFEGPIIASFGKPRRTVWR